MLNVERPVGVGCNPGETVLEDDLHDLAIMTTVTDPLVVQIFYDFHGFFSFFYFWYYQNDTRYGRIYSNIAISF